MPRKIVQVIGGLPGSGSGSVGEQLGGTLQLEHDFDTDGLSGTWVEILGGGDQTLITNGPLRYTYPGNTGNCSVKSIGRGKQLVTDLYEGVFEWDIAFSTNYRVFNPACPSPGAHKFFWVPIKPDGNFRFGGYLQASSSGADKIHMVVDRPIDGDAGLVTANGVLEDMFNGGVHTLALHLRTPQPGPDGYIGLYLDGTLIKEETFTVAGSNVRMHQILAGRNKDDHLPSDDVGDQLVDVHAMRVYTITASS